MASILFTIGGAVVNALAFSTTNFVLRIMVQAHRLLDHGAEECKRHDLLRLTVRLLYHHF